MRDIKNPISSLIQSHRSIRRYTDAPIPDEVLQDILDSAQWAPSHHNVQAYSIIIVKDKEKKKILSKYCASQKYVESCPVFLVFCADFHRLHLACEMNGKQIAVDEVENLLIGAVDTVLQLVYHDPKWTVFFVQVLTEILTKWGSRGYIMPPILPDCPFLLNLNLIYILCSQIETHAPHS